MTTSNLIVPRRVFDEIGLFANLCYAHDLDLSCGWSWKGVPSVTCRRRCCAIASTRSRAR
jgi:hypothetical protein